MKMWEEAPQTEVFGIPVYTFGLYVMIGALCAAVCIMILCRELKTRKGTAGILTFVSIALGLAASRLCYCLARLAEDLVGGGDMLPFSAWIRVDIGGWSLYGMIFGVFLAAGIVSRATREKTVKLLDIVSCAVPLAIAAERAGEKVFEVFNVSRPIAGDQFPANTFLAVHDPVYGDNYLATYYYCAAAAVVLFLTLVFMLTRSGRWDGDVWILFMILCGAGGILLESLRYDSFMEISFVRLQQVAAAVLLVWGVIAAGRRSGESGKKLFRAALISLPAVIGICIGIEFALDKTTISHVLLYVLMAALLAVPAILGIILLGEKEKGKEAA